MSSLRVAFGLLTVIPLSMHEAAPRDVRRALAWYPVVGSALGGVLAAVAWLLADRVPPPVLAVVLVAALALLSGGLHLDGLADWFDALGGGHGHRQRMLDIMRDPRVGAHGAAALVLLLAAKLAAAAVLCAERGLWAFIAAATVSRFSVVPLVLWFPLARREGLAVSAKPEGRGWIPFAVSLSWTALVVAASGPVAIVPAVLSLLAAVLVGLWARRRLGGLTGDIYGSALELAETTLLLSATVDWLPA